VEKLVETYTVIENVFISGDWLENKKIRNCFAGKKRKLQKCLFCGKRWKPNIISGNRVV